MEKLWKVTFEGKINFDTTVEAKNKTEAICKAKKILDLTRGSNFKIKWDKIEASFIEIMSN